MKNLKNFTLLLILPALFFFNSCKKDDDKNSPTPTPQPPAFNQNTIPEMSMKVDGVTISYKHGVNNIFEGLSETGEIGITTSQSIVGAYWYKDDNINPIETLFSIDKGTMIYSPSDPLDSAKFVSFFAQGTHPYSPETYASTSANIRQGVEISYFDTNGNLWSSAIGSGDQTGSVFTIHQTHFYRFNGKKYIKVKMSFNCKIYDGNGAVKTITDGEAIMDFNTSYGN